MCIKGHVCTPGLEVLGVKHVRMPYGLAHGLSCDTVTSLQSIARVVSWARKNCAQSMLSILILQVGWHLQRLGQWGGGLCADQRQFSSLKVSLEQDPIAIGPLKSELEKM